MGLWRRTNEASTSSSHVPKSFSPRGGRLSLIHIVLYLLARTTAYVAVHPTVNSRPQTWAFRSKNRIGVRAFSSPQLTVKPPSLLEDDQQLKETSASELQPPSSSGEKIEEGEESQPEQLLLNTDRRGHTADSKGSNDEADEPHFRRPSAQATTNLPIQIPKVQDKLNVTRRQWLQQCAAVVGGTALTSAALKGRQQIDPEEQQLKSFIRLEPYPGRQEAAIRNKVRNITSVATNKTALAARKNATQPLRNSNLNTTRKELAPVNFTRVAAENSINITSKDNVRIDQANFQKIKDPDSTLWWLPKFFQPAPKIIKQIPDEEVLVAATIAGSSIEMVRTLLLYPLATIKTRIQTRQQQRQALKRMQRLPSGSSSLRIHASQMNHHNLSAAALNPRKKRREGIRLRRQLRVLQLKIRRHVREGDLYAGLLPSLLVSVPATGVYYGARDLTKRMLYSSPMFDLDDAIITLLGALVADVASLMVRTPADALAARLQAVAASSSVSPSTGRKRVSPDSPLVAYKNLANTTSFFSEAPAEISGSQQQVKDVRKKTDAAPKAVNGTATAPEPSTFAEYSRISYEVSAACPNITAATGTANESLANSTMEAVEETLFHEEEEHYKRKETTVSINDTRADALEKLASAMQPEEWEREEQILLQQLQRIEVNTASEFQRRPKRSREQQEERERAMKKKDHSRKKRKHGTSKTVAITAEHQQPYSYTLDFLDDEKQNVSSFFDDMDTAAMTTTTTTQNWDAIQTIKIIQKVQPNVTEIPKQTRTLGTGNDPGTSNQRETNGTWNWSNDTSITDLLTSGLSDENSTSTTSLREQVEDDDIRMEQEEENRLVKDLQEESVYQGKWFLQSLQRLPAIIITDLPYLLSRIAINRIIIHGKVNFGEYEIATIVIAMFCALLTTPFDVVRTRLLVENEENSENSIVNGEIDDGNAALASLTDDGRVVVLRDNTTHPTLVYPYDRSGHSTKSVIQTMISIAREGDGGVRNLYAGWLERTVYLGIGRAWLDPINIITYIGIRDTLLLKWFD